jgi:hypothetical protein
LCENAEQHLYTLKPWQFILKDQSDNQASLEEMVLEMDENRSNQYMRVQKMVEIVSKNEASNSTLLANNSNNA